MRALKMLGLAEDGAHLVYEDPKSGDLYAVAADERLRNAVHVESSRPAQRRSVTQENEMEPQLRPREIQARIRSGASLEQVAEEAGCEPSRIEHYAYPVLMERSVMADRGKSARPVLEGAPSRKSVEQLVRETLRDRGQSGPITWDAYRAETGSWVLKLSWHVGHTENAARWTFYPSAGGGSLTPLDDGAIAIIDPAPRPLRTVVESASAQDQAPVEVNPMATQAGLPEPVAERPSPPPASRNKVADALAHHAVTSPHAAQTAANEHAQSQAAPRGFKRASMPSWEDVLLGVRSTAR